MGLSNILFIPGLGGQRGLLDIYPNAAVAYSLRKLRTAYTGNCIRVRRSSDNAEQDIGFSEGFLNTASLLSFVGANNGFVTTWYDQSGLARNATQSTTTAQPVIVSSGALVTSGGRAAVEGNGTTHFMGIGGLGAIRNVGNAFGWCVAQRLSITEADGCLVSWTRNGNSNQGRFTLQVSVGQGANEFGGGCRRTDADAFTRVGEAPGNNDRNLFHWFARYSAGQCGYARNAGSVSTAALPGGSGLTSDTDSDVAQLFRLGDSETIGTANARMQEVVVWTQDLDLSRNAIRNAINQYWGVY